MGVPRAQLRGQPGVTIRNVSSFTTVQEAHALLLLLLLLMCVFFACRKCMEEREVMSYELNEG